MSVSLSSAEAAIATELQRRGMTRSCSVLAVVMATRAHARPEDELTEIVRQYPGLEAPAEARRSIRTLVDQGWLATSSAFGRQVTHQVPDLRDRIASEVGDVTVAARLQRMRASLEPYVTVVGPMSDQMVYDSFLRLLGGAQYRICLPMLATTPYDDVVAALRERADAGVRVEILLGAPSLVARWRGSSMRGIADERVRRWTELFRGHPHVEVRVSGRADDMVIATCAGIDETICRLDVYDPSSQRSLEGIMVEISSPQGMSLNVVAMFHDRFDHAWRAARPVGWRGTLAAVVQYAWKPVLAAAFIATAFLPVPLPRWPEISLGIATGIIAPVLIDNVPRLRRSIGRRRRSRGTT